MYNCWFRNLISMLGIHFSYNKKTQTDKNYLTTVRKIENDAWITRTLTVEGKIFIFKTLGISKIVYLSLIITVPNSILEKNFKIQETFLWYSSMPKINHKHSVIHLKMVKNVDVKSKIISLQCSWVKVACVVDIKLFFFYGLILL